MEREKKSQLPDPVEVRVEEDSGIRLDAYLAERLPLSRSRVAGLLEQGKVLLDGRPARKSYRPRSGDLLVIELPPAAASGLVPEPNAVPIVYEDDDLLVVDKPAGMVVHPAPGHPGGTLVHSLLSLPGGLSSIGSPLRPGIVHRLDRDTSGLMVVARSDAAHAALASAIAERRVGRGYVAACWGRLEPEQSTIDRPIARHPVDRKRMAIVEGGRRAVTHVRRLERFIAADLLAIRLETGRTHQIRVHLSDAGHPIVGDPVYGKDWQKGFTGAGGRWAEEFARRTGRLFLHSARLTFRHPSTGERLAFSSRLPPPLSEAVEWARVVGQP